MNIGEYVRINEDRRIICLGIGKVVNKVKETIYVEMGIGLPVSYNIDKIANHSENIIELIEVGDFVNENKVIQIADGLVFVDKLFYDERTCEERHYVYTNNEIQEILTKEQYEKNVYKVEV